MSPTRRGVLQVLAIVAGLFTLLGGAERAAGKRKGGRPGGKRHGRNHPRRRHARHRNHHHNKKKQKCTPDSMAETCAGTCGTIENNCQKSVECGSCACEPACDACFTCQEGPNTPGECIVDPIQQGQACGTPGQICHPEGACACDASSCPPATPLCVGDACTGCTESAACEAAGRGDLCCDGACVRGVCCADNACQTAGAPDCIDNDCVCAGNGNTSCNGSEVCCDDGCFDLQTDPDHCGDCETACPGEQICQGGVCGVDCGGTFCPAATAICVDGVCQACTVTCSATPAACRAALQAALLARETVYACPGRYGGNFVIADGLSVHGAGGGDDPATSTMLDAQGVGHALEIVGGTGAVALAGLRLTGGGGLNSLGGGVTIENFRTVTMTRCTVSGNQTSNPGNGGGIFTGSGGSLTLADCLVADNDASEHVGGIFAFGDTTLTGSTEVRGNEAGFRGGGIYVDFGMVTVDAGCRVTANEAPAGQGGGIYDAGTPGTVLLANDQIVTDNIGGNCAGGPINNCNG